MNTELITKLFNESLQTTQTALMSQSTYTQLVAIVLVYVFAFWLVATIRKNLIVTNNAPDENIHPVRKLAYRIAGVLYPIVAIMLMRILIELSENQHYPVQLMSTALVVAILLFFNSLVGVFVISSIAAVLFRWIGLPILSLHLLGFLPTVIKVLEKISLSAGNIDISLYGLVRVIIFVGLLFWLGRASNVFGKDIIRKQQNLDIRTREVFSKLYEVVLFTIIILLLFNVMGINLTTLAVFGGAVGVGIGLGLQSIASNFISGIIILLDESLTVGDFVELEDGSKGFVREFGMRCAVLETYDGKDILVPNEKFISASMVNWTHKDPKQRYRVDFSVSYSTDVRAMVDIIKVAVAEHPQVISGPDVPFEEQPDCEIDSFGDSGVNMFIEYWIEGIDDGKNRVGGDLLLTVLETLKENGIEIPFPQREVRVLNDNNPTFHRVD